MGTAVWMIWATVIIAAAANAVNLTDGLDGLAAGSSTFCFATLAIIGYWQYRHFSIYHVGDALDLALASVALAGACVGFLWWNAAPAKIFMGDTGSLVHRLRPGRPLPADEPGPPAGHPGRPVRDHHALGGDPGRSASGCSTAGCSSWPRSTTTSS